MRASIEQNFPRKLLEEIHRIARTVKKAGGRILVVGGAVRDALLGNTATDIDLEAYGLGPADLEKTLQSVSPVFSCGRAFPVFKVKHQPIDIALPRTEVSTGPGHRDFEVRVDPNLPYEKAAARRDFTINAILWDPLEKKIIDPLGGVGDLERSRLRHASGQFAEDPLRVLRGARFAGRFLMDPDPDTLRLCSTLQPNDLAIERIWQEWKNILSQTREPSRSLRWLQASAWLRFYPELEALIGCPQDPEWHPEGDVWTHTLHSLDAFARHRTGDDREDLVVGLAVLCHDLGKPITTIEKAGRIRSPAHDREGEKPTREFLARICPEHRIVEEVVPLVREHLRPREFFHSGASDTALRRLSLRAGRIDRLVRVAQADAAGRPPLPEDFPEGPWLMERAEALKIRDNQPRPLVQGRHLIHLGLRPGPRFKKILEACYQAQLEGKFNTTEGGIEHIKNSLLR